MFNLRASGECEAKDVDMPISQKPRSTQKRRKRREKNAHLANDTLRCGVYASNTQNVNKTELGRKKISTQPRGKKGQKSESGGAAT